MQVREANQREAYEANEGEEEPGTSPTEIWGFLRAHVTVLTLARNAGRVVQSQMLADGRPALASGDALRAFSAVSVALSTQQQSKRVRIEGEVRRPADYVLPADSSVRDAMQAAGGFTEAAFVCAAEFTRLSEQRTQRENYERALRDLETDITRAAGSQRVSSAETAAVLQAHNVSSERLVGRLRSLRQTGRVGPQIAPNITELPDLALEDGDRVYIPARPTTVGVFGSVFNAASYLYPPGRSIEDCLKLAGGPTKGADESSVFVVRTNGDVVSSRQSAGWFSRSGTLGRLGAEPGDTLVVPEELDKTTFLQTAKDWTLLLYQLGVGAAGIQSALRRA